MKSFRGIIPDFLFINNNTKLEEVILDKNEYRDEIEVEDEINALKKFIEIKTLKKIEINVRLSKLKDDIEQIGENYSVQTLKILDKTKVSHDPHFLLKKYPNLTNLSIRTNSGGGVVFIEEEPISKIDKLDLKLNRNYIIICGPYENLKTFKLFINSTELKKFPLFLDKCEVSFKNLSEFYLQTYKTKIDMLKNLYKNIDCMPNLKNFTLFFDAKVEKEFHLNFVKKLLSLNLNKIYFIIEEHLDPYIIYPLFEKKHYKDIYSFDEIEAICPGVNCYKYEKLFIQKYNQS